MHALGWESKKRNLTKWGRWTPPENLVDDGAYIRQIISIPESWDPLPPHDCIKLRLSLLHSVRIQQHRKREGSKLGEALNIVVVSPGAPVTSPRDVSRLIGAQLTVSAPAALVDHFD